MPGRPNTVVPLPQTWGTHFGKPSCWSEGAERAPWELGSLGRHPRRKNRTPEVVNSRDTVSSEKEGTFTYNFKGPRTFFL